MITSNLLNRVSLGSHWTCVKNILMSGPSSNTLFCRELSNNMALISKVHRESFLRTYQSLIVQSDGSSYNVRYHEPRSIVQFPLDVTTLSPEEMKLRVARRFPKKKVVYVQEEKDTYQPSKYIKLVKKTKT